MKWLFYLIVFGYMCYRAVYGLKSDNIIVENYGRDGFISAGEHKTITCKPTNRNQKVEWTYPNGTVVKQVPKGRIYSQNHLVQSQRGKLQALMLTIRNAMVQDTGIYHCRSGEITEDVSLCVIKPSEFTNTQAVVTVEAGRPITLSCQARGNPEPNIVWKRNEETLIDEETSGKYKISKIYNMEGYVGQLTITSLEAEDSGIYSCVSVQQIDEVENCLHMKTQNISLNIIKPPTFDDGNVTDVFGMDNDEVKLICSAQGFPTPTYRWFKVLQDKTLFEFNRSQLQLTEDGSQSVLPVIMSSTTLGQTFKCQATNDHGSSDKYFTLAKMMQPEQIETVEVSKVTAHSIQLLITWASETDFPVDAFEVQYIENKSGYNKRRFGKESAWKDKVSVDINLDKEAIVSEDSEAIPIDVTGLKQDTSYAVRIRAFNQAGISPWSSEHEQTVFTKTLEQDDTQEMTEDETQEPLNKVVSDSSFYGIFFAGGILGVAFVYMFAMKMVK